MEAGDSTGSQYYQITVNQLPSHAHYINLQATGGAHLHGISVDNGQGNRDWGVSFQYHYNSAFNSGCFSGTDGNHTHNITGNTNNTGLGESIYNMQPSKVICRWHRIS